MTRSTKCHLPLRVPEPAVTKGGAEDFLLVNRFSMSSKMSSLEVWQNAALQVRFPVKPSDISACAKHE